MDECLVPQIERGKACDVTFHMLKKSGRPYKIDTYSIKAEYKDVFGNVISTYAYPVEQHRKPIYVNYNKVKLILAPKETMHIGRYDVFISIVLDEHVCIHAKRTVEIILNEDCCCCSDDIHFDIPICQILYEDGRTYTPVINAGWLSFTLDDVPPPDPINLIPTVTIINGTWWVNGEDTEVPAEAVPGPKGDKGDPGINYLWRCSRIEPQVGDTVMINHEWHVLTEDDLPPPVGTILVLKQ